MSLSIEPAAYDTSVNPFSDLLHAAKKLDEIENQEQLCERCDPNVTISFREYYNISGSSTPLTGHFHLHDVGQKCGFYFVWNDYAYGDEWLSVKAFLRRFAGHTTGSTRRERVDSFVIDDTPENKEKWHKLQTCIFSVP